MLTYGEGYYTFGDMFKTGIAPSIVLALLMAAWMPFIVGSWESNAFGFATAFPSRGLRALSEPAAFFTLRGNGIAAFSLNGVSCHGSLLPVFPCIYARDDFFVRNGFAKRRFAQASQFRGIGKGHEAIERRAFCHSVIPKLVA